MSDNNRIMKKGKREMNHLADTDGNGGELTFAIEPPKSKRIYYIDLLRVIACAAVVIIHASSLYVKKDIGTLNFLVGDIFDGLARVAVPLFVMISGALMLNEEYKFGRRKLIIHIKRMIVFFIFWSLLYCMVFRVAGQIAASGKIDIVKDLWYFIKGHYHLWFVYLIIGLYLILPLLRLWVKKNNKKYVRYFIILAIVFTFTIPQIIKVGANYNSIFGELNEILNNKLYLQYVGGYTAYFILGWYLHNYDIKHKNLVYAFGVLGFVVSVVGTYLLSVNAAMPVQMYDDLSLNVLLPSVAMFLFVKDKVTDAGQKENRIVKFISNNSLGIYAIHALIIALCYKVIGWTGFDVALINIPIVFVIAFLISLLISYIFSKIGFLRKVV